METALRVHAAQTYHVSSVPNIIRSVRLWYQTLQQQQEIQQQREIQQQQQEIKQQEIQQQQEIQALKPNINCV